MNKKLRLIKFRCLSFLITGIFSFLSIAAFSQGNLKITFLNTANGKPIVLRDSLYENHFGEKYQVSKLKYYISNVGLQQTGKPVKQMGGYYLINAANDENSINLSLPPGKYSGLAFLLGVDSIRNCSGAQTDALDPMNDMFWTWNSGYVMFKMEGNSPASTADLNRIEHHVGGYKAPNNVATSIGLIHSIEIKSNGVTEIVIETNLDHYWYGNADIRIAELPICTLPGDIAKKIASNFKNLFSVKSIAFIK